MDSRIVAILKLSLLKLAQLASPLIMTPGAKAVYNKIAFLSSDFSFAYNINKERRDSSACDLHQLAKLHSIRADF